jgi:hypothetical protein
VHDGGWREGRGEWARRGGGGRVTEEDVYVLEAVSENKLGLGH